MDYLRLKQTFCLLASEGTTLWSFFWFEVRDMEKLLDFWVVFLSTAVLSVCDVLRQIILSFGGCSGRSEDLSAVPALPILPGQEVFCHRSSIHIGTILVL